MTLLGAWPPVLLGLVVWMFVQARQDLRTRACVWLLSPVVGVPALPALGGVHGAILIEDESDAVAARQAILDAVEAVRSGTPVAES